MERYKQPKRSSKKDSEQNEPDFKIHKKVAHNAVECRRKQRISHYISELSSTLDTCHCGKEVRIYITGVMSEGNINGIMSECVCV
jgi:hypothetical protein